MKNKNQIICDRIAAWDLPDEIRAVVDTTEYRIMDELFGGIETPEELVAFIEESGLMDD